MGALKPVGQLYGSPTALTNQYLAWDRYCTYVFQTPRVERKFGNHVTVRPPDCPSVPQAYQCNITQSTGTATQMQLEVVLAGNRITNGVL